MPINILCVWFLFKQQDATAGNSKTDLEKRVQIYEEKKNNNIDLKFYKSLLKMLMTFCTLLGFLSVFKPISTVFSHLYEVP